MSYSPRGGQDDLQVHEDAAGRADRGVRVSIDRGSGTRKDHAAQGAGQALVVFGPGEQFDEKEDDDEAIVDEEEDVDIRELDDP
jgi:hypothetical protein